MKIQRKYVCLNLYMVGLGMVGRGKNWYTEDTFLRNGLLICRMRIRRSPAVKYQS